MSVNNLERLKAAHRLETRIEQGRKLRYLYRYLGYTRAQVATFLHVSERSVFRWEAGTSPIPFAVLKLLRLLAHQELPGASWAGWCFNRGTLWSPEGRGFAGKDFSWLSMLARRASAFGKLYKENIDLRAQLRTALTELGHAEARALSAEKQTAIAELAVFGALAKTAESEGTPPAGSCGIGRLSGDVPVTRHQLLDFEQVGSISAPQRAAEVSP
ncbi:VC1465 family Xer recombination activation factor [Roseateles sp. PN1]|uniref:VC1465 family Xer recombination activation factor n=1 Tax=Roseateles sp. PN1 TaxID=3137372 RepID=UPI003138EEFA